MLKQEVLMMPITPLMIEHGLIERVIVVIKEETEKCKLEGRMKHHFYPVSILLFTDFFAAG
jgi:hypothetical protein